MATIGEATIDSLRKAFMAGTSCVSNNRLSDAAHRLHARRSAYRYSRYGWIGQVYALLGFFSTDSLRKSHWNINCWTSEEAFAWKETCMASHNFVMVAATIFVSVGLFAQTQPSMTDVHWSARALLIASMVSGIASVVSATLIQDSLRRLHTHMDIRLWLSNGISTSRERYKDPYHLLPLESSVAALKLVEAPGEFLVLAVMLYILGYGDYLLFAWLYELRQPSTDFRNIFIVYVAVVFLSLGYFGTLGIGQLLGGQRLQERLRIDQAAPRIHASKQYRNLERIITLLIEFRKRNEEKAQVGTESIEDSTLLLELLLQEWETTERRGRHGFRSIYSPREMSRSQDQGLNREEDGDADGWDNVDSDRRGYDKATRDEEHAFPPRPAARHAVTDSDMPRDTPFDHISLDSGPASR